VNWQGVHTHEQLHRIAAPTYPFERKRYWVDPQEPVRRASSRSEAAEASTRTDGSEERPSTLHSRAYLLNPYVAPRNEIESSIAAVWQELLGLKQVGIYDDYLEVGGHSLLAARIVARLRDIFEIPLPLSSFFEASTIAELARVIEELLIEKVEALSEEEIQHLL
jgi:acyl transferase domain-containing protein